MTDHKKPGVAFWATVVVVAVLVGYPLSFGPACCIAAKLNSSDGSRPASLIALANVYRPLVFAKRDKHKPLAKPARRYVDLFPNGGFGRVHMEAILRPQDRIVIFPRYD